MNIHSLQYFCSVAKHLNFSKAAEECHIAQTAMSRSIAAMEDELGFRLFDRRKPPKSWNSIISLSSPAGRSPVPPPPG